MTNNQSSVYCANCGRRQPDQGRRGTCVDCGCSPLPSYDYEPDNSFYPRLHKPTALEALRQQRQARKAR